MFDLKKTEKHLLDCLNAAEDATKNKKDDTYFKIRIPPGFHFPVNKEIKNYLNKALCEIMKDEPIKTNLPGEYVKEGVENILSYVFDQPKSQRNNILNKELIRFRKIIKEKLKNEINDYTFTLHIDKLKIDEDITIGDVTFYRIDENKINTNKAKEIEKSHPFRQKLIEHPSNFIMNECTYAEVHARGTQDYAYTLALYKIRLALNIIKLYTDPKSTNFGLDGETSNLIYRKSLLQINEDDSPYFRMELVGGNPNYFLTKDVIQLMEKHGLKEINKFFTNEFKLTEYENRLLTGIYWFGEAISVNTFFDRKDSDGKRNNVLENLHFFSRAEKLLKLFTALESVLIFNDNESITENIAERAAILVFDDYDNRVETKKRVKEIYRDRSKIVHRGVTYVSKHDLKWLIDCVRAVLITLIKLNEKYDFKDKKQLKIYIEKLKFS